MNLRYMGVVNLNSDSFYAPSRVKLDSFLERVEEYAKRGASYIDIGAVSSRPGALEVGVEEEWRRLEPALSLLSRRSFPSSLTFSIDTTSAEIVRRCFSLIGSFTVNDISAGEEDAAMLATVGELGLEYVAMHKRGNPRTMDSLCSYKDGVVPELISYFKSFSAKALDCGISSWILDPGLGFAKTAEQNWEILSRLSELAVFSRPILVGAADKRFTGGDTERAHRVAFESLSSCAVDLILRVHEINSGSVFDKLLGR